LTRDREVDDHQRRPDMSVRCIRDADGLRFGAPQL
jgi:hypothetical protein